MKEIISETINLYNFFTWRWRKKTGKKPQKPEAVIIRL